jgi:hypothetical protein
MNFRNPALVEIKALGYEPEMDARQDRRWHSWEEFMREWCQQEGFRAYLPELLRGEDPDFAHHFPRLAQEEATCQASTT